MNLQAHHRTGQVQEPKHDLGAPLVADLQRAGSSPARPATAPPRIGGGPAAVAAALAVGVPVPVAAAAPDFSIVLPAGVACAFDLGVEGTGDKRIMREFTDQNGNPVRTLAAGKGFTLTFTNLSTDNSLTLPSSGSVQRTTVNSDGTSTVVSPGHNVLIFFPTDIPAGPSTTLYVGQVVYTVDASGVFTLQSTSGSTTDLCALLA